MVVVGCPTETEPEETDTWTWKESLRKYMGPQPNRWTHNDGSSEVDDDADTLVYFLDPAHFEDFRAELEAGGEYIPDDDPSWNETGRDWEQGKNFVRWAERPDGAFELNLCKSDNSVTGYRYTKVPTTQRPKLDASLRKYMGSCPQTWEHDGVKDDEDTLVYFLDPAHFEDFRTELEAAGKYSQVDNSGSYTRDWEEGKAFARWAVRPGERFELGNYKSDNSSIQYQYTKVP
jgi:hypothetical protein